jgi:predicted flap endonuclease-1-like 5' DNA nuclease
VANKKIEEIEGIGPAFGEKLRAAGIEDTDGLLELCCSKPGRAKVAAQSGISESRLLEWANMADLFRIKGVGPEFAELLEASGVDTVKELATRNADNLAAKLAEVNDAKKLTRRVPNAEGVADWVAQAKALPARITH